MSSKRPNLDDSVEQVSQASESPARREPRKHTKGEIIGITLYMPKATHASLKTFAISKETSLQQLIVTALESYLNERAQGFSFYAPGQEPKSPGTKATRAG